MVSFKGKTKTEYKYVAVPVEMVTEIKRIVEFDKGLGFVSVQEFIKASLRDSLGYYGERAGTFGGVNNDTCIIR